MPFQSVPCAWRIPLEATTLHAEHTSTPSASLSHRSFSLHLLRDLHVHLEELCDTSIEADGFGLVEISFAVVGRYTFLQAG
jgi:hypothetical protein